MAYPCVDKKILVILKHTAEQSNCLKQADEQCVLIYTFSFILLTDIKTHSGECVNKLECVPHRRL
jgi:hypothetical protein